MVNLIVSPTMYQQQFLILSLIVARSVLVSRYWSPSDSFYPFSAEDDL
jgi:hypothetical protein